VEPPRAKCGWIVALGITYVLAELIALSSVALASKGEVRVMWTRMRKLANDRRLCRSADDKGAQVRKSTLEPADLQMLSIPIKASADGSASFAAI
jgi:hypothetical protein